MKTLWPTNFSSEETPQTYLLKCSQRGQSYDEKWSWWMRSNININATSDCIPKMTTMRYYCWKLGTLKDWPRAFKPIPIIKKPCKSIYLNAANEANHTMKSGHDGCVAISISMPPLIATLIERASIEHWETHSNP